MTKRPTFDIGEYVIQGYRFSQAGSVTNVISPDNRHGAGSSPEEAVLNIDSVIVPAEGGRIRIRADGSEIALDEGAMSPDRAAKVAADAERLAANERAVADAQATAATKAARIAAEEAAAKVAKDPKSDDKKGGKK